MGETFKVLIQHKGVDATYSDRAHQSVVQFPSAKILAISWDASATGLFGSAGEGGAAFDGGGGGAELAPAAGAGAESSPL